MNNLSVNAIETKESEKKKLLLPSNNGLLQGRKVGFSTMQRYMIGLAAIVGMVMRVTLRISSLVYNSNSDSK